MATTTLSTQTISEMVHKLEVFPCPHQSLRGWLRSLRRCFATSKSWNLSTSERPNPRPCSTFRE